MSNFFSQQLSSISQVQIVNNELQKFTFKVYRENLVDEMKRFTLMMPQIQITTLMCKARALFNLADQDIIGGRIRFMYQDHEGDYITLKTDEELLTAVCEQAFLYNKNYLCLVVCVTSQAKQQGTPVLRGYQSNQISCINEYPTQPKAQLKYPKPIFQSQCQPMKDKRNIQRSESQPIMRQLSGAQSNGDKSSAFNPQHITQNGKSLAQPVLTLPVVIQKFILCITNSGTEELDNYGGCVASDPRRLSYDHPVVDSQVTKGGPPLINSKSQLLNQMKQKKLQSMIDAINQSRNMSSFSYSNSLSKYNNMKSIAQSKARCNSVDTPGDPSNFTSIQSNPDPKDCQQNQSSLNPNQSKKSTMIEANPSSCPPHLESQPKQYAKNQASGNDLILEVEENMEFSAFHNNTILQSVFEDDDS